MLKADLHTHSDVSDGSATVAEMIEIAARKGLYAIAVTDHDTLSHIAQIPKDSCIKVIGGIEISAMDKTRGIGAHILGYGIRNTDMIETLVQPLLKSRHQNSLIQMDILCKHGFSFDIGEMKKADGKYIYKQHIMEYLVRTGQAAEMFGEFYRSTFEDGGICAFDIDYIDVYEAVKTIRRAGGQPVLAHAGQQQNFYLIPELIKWGLNGIEYNHPANGHEDKLTIKRLAEEHGLYLTGGSDSHGSFDEPIVEIGSYVSEESGVEALC